MSSKVRRRLQQGAGFRRRDAAEGEAEGPRVLRGHAAVFGESTVLYRARGWEVREVIRPGAFRNALAERMDVRALIDHNSTLILGRTASGTLRLSEDARGLAVEIDPPDTQAARDLLVSIDRGDVSQMSFAFVPRKGGEVITTRMDGDLEVTTVELIDLDLYDVSAVTYPQYPGTDIRAGGEAADVVDKVKADWLAEPGRAALFAELERRGA
ncbi:HK97 family phage prohead protease [Paludisphaera soli]|uniref:HK97 family phage prohead protease n=1 Tax=Paludisphaera soli TaxID=2712865 RepID=UPI0013E9D01D|nr:HK97 family phage prohead protease [Paludisphaera soli]